MRRGLRWGIAGASDIAAESIIPAIRAQPASQVVALHSRSAERGAAFAARHGIPRSHDRLEALLRDDVDAVYVCSTNDRHASQTIAAAGAGRHVLCEKPLALDLDSAAAMVQACRAAGVVLGTNHGRRNDPAVRAARDLVRSGRLGTPLAARTATASLLPPRLRGWRLDDRLAGGGVVLDLVVHEADTLRFVLDDEPAAVHASVAAQDAPGAVEDGVMGVLRMRGGLLASFYCSFLPPGGPVGLEVHGGEASLRTSRRAGAPSTLVLVRADGEQVVPLPQPIPAGVATVAAFEASVRGEGAPTATGDDGLASLAVALATLESARLQRVVVLPRP